MNDTLEKKSIPGPRKKKYMRGVCYDKRSKKFVASITIDGRRIHLGSFEDEDDAAGAHALARHDNPIKRGAPGGGPSFSDGYDDFLMAYAEEYGLPKGRLQEGAEFMAPNGQRYVLAAMDVVYKPNSKAKWSYNRWHSTCSECGADFITSQMTGSKRVSGFTRTCPTHRRGGPRGDEPTAHAILLKSISAEKKIELQAAEIEAKIPAEVYMAAMADKAKELGRRLTREEAHAVEQELLALV